MSHETVIADLKALNKVDLLAIDAEEHTNHMRGESDRASMILGAAMVEEALLRLLKANVKHRLNSAEMQRLFGYEGPVGSFSNRIRVSQAFGIIDRETRRRVDVIKEIRNAAAHSHSELTFTNDPIRAALVYIAGSKELWFWDNAAVRQFYEFTCIVLMSKISRLEGAPDLDHAFRSAQAAFRGRRASPGKSAAE